MNFPEQLKRLEIEDDIIFALDIGTRSIIGIVGIKEGQYFKVLDFEVKEHTQRAMIDGQIIDIEEVSRVTGLVHKSLEQRLGKSLKHVCVAAAGRSLKTSNSRYELLLEEREPISYQDITKLEVGAVDEACKVMDSSNEQEFNYICVGFSVSSYYLDDYPIKNLLNHRGKNISVEIIATFLPEHVVESLYTSMHKAGLQIASLTLEPIAAINAIIPEELRLLNLALVDIGAGTSDIAISNQGKISAYTMAAVAGDEITEAIIQALLVDFATAEALKINSSLNQDPLTYNDILGLEYTISNDEFLDIIKPAIENLSDVICEKILVANGQAPVAIFLVGGGSQTPFIAQFIADKLKIDKRKVAIGSQNYLKRVTIGEFDINGPQYATPLGIGITAALNRGGQESFTFDVNGKKIRIFNNYKLSLMEALLMSGYQHTQIITRSGRSMSIEINGQKKIVRGELAKNADILLNNQVASLLTPIKPGDQIVFSPAIAGKDAVYLISDVIKEMQNKLELTNDNYNVEIILNGQPAQAMTHLKNFDVLNITFHEKQENQKIAALDQSKNGLEITLNKTPLILSPKEDNSDYLFVDLFNYVEIDPKQPQGNIVLKRNGHTASYIEMLNEGDEIFIYWDSKK